MKNYFLISLFLLSVSFSLSAQLKSDPLPEFNLEKDRLEAQLRFLASDELKGRRTGSPGNTISARFIASHLKSLGYASPGGAEGFFQKINFVVNKPPQSGSLALQKTSFTLGEDLIILDGPDQEVEATAVFAGYGWVDEATGRNDYQDLDVAGKVVVVFSGLPDNNNPAAVFEAMGTKKKLAIKHGAVALVEVYTLSYPWQFFRNYFSRERIELRDPDGEGENLPYAWIQGADQKVMGELKAGKKVPVIFESSAPNYRSLASQNVIGVLEGSDPELKDEYVLITAHYDHVGTGKDGGAPFSDQDSIFNGARDNAMGVVAMMAAAEALAKRPPKRSVIILAVTAEEMGLLGSQYYADHPLIPLEKTVFNLNTDGAGYDVTTGLAVIGWDRTGTNELVEKGLQPFQLEVIPDPAKEQNLFDRSDNVSFARKGIPCLTLSPGFKGFTKELMQYYHQVSDEADGLDFDYVKKFCQAFAHTARLIADSDQRPSWVRGDKYESAGKQLYGSGK